MNRLSLLLTPLTGRDLAGNSHPWSRYAGKVVLLNFWASWCFPCVKEVPNVMGNLKKYQSAGFRIVGVSHDKSKDDLQKSIKSRQITFPNIYGGRGQNNINAHRYGVRTIPFTLLIGKDRKIAAVNPRGLTLEVAIKKALRAK